MPFHGYINLQLRSEVEWPSLPRPIATQDGTRSFTLNLQVNVAHFADFNITRKPPVGRGGRLVGYAAAVKQDLARGDLLRRIAKARGSAILPTELKLKIFAHVFGDWLGYAIMPENPYWETVEQAIDRLFSNCEDLTELRDIARTAAEESVVFYEQSINPDTWDAVAWISHGLSTQKGRDKVKVIENHIYIPTLMRHHNISATTYLPFDRTNEDLRLYEDPEEVQMLLAPLAGLRKVTFLLEENTEADLLGSLKKLAGNDGNDRLHFFFNSLLALVRYKPHMTVVVEARAGIPYQVIAAVKLAPRQLVDDLCSELIEAVTHICDFVVGRAEYEEEMKDRVMSD